MSDLWALSGLRLTPYLMALAAIQRGLKVTFWGSSVAARSVAWGVPLRVRRPHLFTIEGSGRSHFFDSTQGDKISARIVSLCRNKRTTKEELGRAGIGMPEGVVFSGNNRDEVLAFLEHSASEFFVTKPVKGSRSRSVTRGLTRDRIVKFLGQSNPTALMIEEQAFGREYRVYVVGDRVAGAYLRPEAVVVGNNRDTIAQLIRKRNEERKRNLHFAAKPVDFAKVAVFIARTGRTLNTVPVLGQRVRLSDSNSKSEGGSVVEATAKLPASVAETAIAACRAIGLPHGGLDVIDCGDRVVILEANTRAIIDNHSFPETGSGSANVVAEAIVDYHFPSGPYTERDHDVRADFQALRAAFVNADDMTRHEVRAIGA